MSGEIFIEHDRDLASDIETDVERLVEVRLLLECLRIPRRRAMQIRDVINNGAESTNHHRSPNGRRVEASLFCAGSRLIRSSISGKHQSHRMATKPHAKLQQRLCTTHNMLWLLAVASVSIIGMELDRVVR